MEPKDDRKPPVISRSEKADCQIDIRIDAKGDVNIYNCAAPGTGKQPCPPSDDHVCPPVSEGACVPVSLGSKPKQSRRRKLDKLLANTQVPSALAASFFHLTRRHLAGKTAANALEERAFATLRKLSPDLRRVLTCALDSFDSLTSNERDKLFARDVLRDIDQPIDVNGLGQAFAEGDSREHRRSVLRGSGLRNPGASRQGQDPAVSWWRVSAAAGARLSCQRPAHGELRPVARLGGLHT